LRHALVCAPADPRGDGFRPARGRDHEAQRGARPFAARLQDGRGLAARGDAEDRGPRAGISAPVNYNSRHLLTINSRYSIIAAKSANLYSKYRKSIEFPFQTLKLRLLHGDAGAKDGDDAALHRDLRWPPRRRGACG